MNEWSFKDFENVRLKATYPIEIGERTFEVGETIVMFDKIQISGLQEVNELISANGGFGNRPWVFWNTTKELNLNFSQGVFSKEQFALLNNARLFENNGLEKPLCVTWRERLESDENGNIVCAHTPVCNVFVYDADTGEKISFTQNEATLNIATPYTNVIVDYQYHYTGNSQIFTIGRKLCNGFLKLEGITRVKDDSTGNVVTGIFVIPKIKLVSDLSIRLGAKATPVTANFQGIGTPVGHRGDSRVVEFYILNDDIQSDL